MCDNTYQLTLLPKKINLQIFMNTFIKMKNKRLIIILLVIAIILLIPLIAMQFTNEVNWNSFDFIAAAALLLGTGLLCELVLRKVKNTKYRIIICVVLLLLLVIIWAELAVGIFGSPIAGE
jgi:peptidoglycan/LPS O-acetylase OafA/YrhL